MTIDKKILICLVAVLLLAPQYHGYKALGDEFATWKNDGFPTEDARCSMAFNIDVEGKR